MTGDPFSSVRRDTHRPFPVEPLLAIVRAAYHDSIKDPVALEAAAHSTGLSAMTRQLHVSPKTARLWIDHGLTVWEADRAAVRLRLHPADIWTDWYEPTETDRRAALDRWVADMTAPADDDGEA